MIWIEISKYPMRIVSKGHAYGAGEPGQNLVCCAVSTLMYDLVEAADYMDINNTVSMDEGFMDVTFTPLPKKTLEADIIFKTIIAGLIRLASDYPEFIMLRKEYD